MHDDTRVFYEGQINSARSEADLLNIEPHDNSEVAPILDEALLSQMADKAIALRHARGKEKPDLPQSLLQPVVLMQTDEGQNKIDPLQVEAEFSKTPANIIDGLIPTLPLEKIVILGEQSNLPEGTRKLIKARTRELLLSDTKFTDLIEKKTDKPLPLDEVTTLKDFAFNENASKASTAMYTETQMTEHFDDFPPRYWLDHIKQVPLEAYVRRYFSTDKSLRGKELEHYIKVIKSLAGALTPTDLDNIRLDVLELLEITGVNKNIKPLIKDRIRSQAKDFWAAVERGEIIPIKIDEHPISEHPMPAPIEPVHSLPLRMPVPDTFV